MYVLRVEICEIWLKFGGMYSISLKIVDDSDLKVKHRSKFWKMFSISGWSIGVRSLEH